MSNQISGGTIHATVPTDLQLSLQSDPKALQLWESLTPLGRNEFICWVENAVKDETRAKRVRRTSEEMFEGKRRPCCWVGCIHRPDKAISPSVQWVINKQSKTKSLPSDSK